MRGQLGLYTLVINLGLLSFAINTFVVAGIMPSVVADIGGMRLYSWTFGMFSVGSVIGAASSGPLRETFGGREAYVLAGAAFLAGLGLAALAPNMETLVAARFLQGLGGGAIASQVYAIMAALFPERLRGHVIAFTSTAWGVATALGPALGGLFAEAGWWRGAFWGMSPLVLAFMGLALRVIPKEEAHGRLAALPYLRLLMLAASVLVLSWTSQSDSGALRLVLIVASVVLAILAFRRDSRAANPMFPKGALRLGSEIGAIYWILLLNSVVITFVNTYATLHMQVLHGASPLTASYLYIAVSVGWSASSFIVPGWRGRMEVFGIVFGLAIVLAGAIGTGYVVTRGPIGIIITFMFVLGLGIGFMNSPLVQRAIRISPDHERHIAGASVQTMRTMGVAFGAAAVGLVAVAAGLVADAATPAVVAHAMQWVYAGAAAVAFLCLLCVFPVIAAHRRSVSP